MKLYHKLLSKAILDTHAIAAHNTLNEVEQQFECVRVYIQR